MPWGGGKKRGVENLTNDSPPKRGFWTPPRTVRFPPPSGVSALFFLYKNPRQSRPEALLEGSKNFRESTFSGTFSSPHTFCTPHITAQFFFWNVHAQDDWKTRVPDNGNEWRKFRVVPRSHSLRPLVFCFFTQAGNRRGFRLPGRPGITSILRRAKSLARVIAESLARVIAAIRIASVRWQSYLPPKHRNWSSQTLHSLCCNSNRAIGVHSFNIRSTWNCGMACES